MTTISYTTTGTSTTAETSTPTDVDIMTTEDYGRIRAQVVMIFICFKTLSIQRYYRKSENSNTGELESLYRKEIADHGSYTAIII